MIYWNKLQMESYKQELVSQVVKRKGWTKVSEDLEEKVISFIENHPSVVQSPIMNMILFLSKTKLIQQ